MQVAGSQPGAGRRVQHHRLAGGRQQQDPVHPGPAVAELHVPTGGGHGPERAPVGHRQPADRLGARPAGRAQQQRVAGREHHAVLPPARRAGARVEHRRLPAGAVSGRPESQHPPALLPHRDHVVDAVHPGPPPLPPHPVRDEVPARFRRGAPHHVHPVVGEERGGPGAAGDRDRPGPGRWRGGGERDQRHQQRHHDAERAADRPRRAGHGVGRRVVAAQVAQIDDGHDHPFSAPPDRRPTVTGPTPDRLYDGPSWPCRWWTPR